jgi:hypothetical protein
MTTEWVNRDNGIKVLPRSKSKWTGLVIEPLTSIYDKVIQDIETEYESYAAAFDNVTTFGGPTGKGPTGKGSTDKGPMDKGPMDKGPMDKGPTVEGFEYEIDNTPIYTSPEPEKEPEEEEEPEEESVKDETKPPPMSDDEKLSLMTSVYDIILRVITILGTLFVSYNLYYTIKKADKHIGFYSLLSFMSFGPFYILTGAMLKTVGFFENAMLNIIPYYLLLTINSTSILGDRALFVVLFMISSSIVDYLKGELSRLYNFFLANPITKDSLYNFLFKSQGNAAVAGLHKMVFIYYFLFNNFSIWDSEAGIVYNSGMIFFKSVGFILWLIFVIVCFSAIFKPMLSFSTLIHFGIVFFYSIFFISYDTKSLNIKTIINSVRSMSFDMNMGNVFFDSYSDNEYKKMFEGAFKELFKMVPYGIMIYAFAVVIPDIMNINVDAAKWPMLGIAIASILGISVSGLREYFIVNKIIKDAKNAIDDRIDDFQNIDWDGITADQARLIQHLKVDTEQARLNV